MMTMAGVVLLVRVHLLDDDAAEPDEATEEATEMSSNAVCKGREKQWREAVERGKRGWESRGRVE